MINDSPFSFSSSSSLFSCDRKAEGTHAHFPDVSKMETRWHIAVIPSLLVTSLCQAPKPTLAHMGRTQQRLQSCCWFKSLCFSHIPNSQGRSGTVLTLSNTACDWSCCVGPELAQVSVVWDILNIWQLGHCKNRFFSGKKKKKKKAPWDFPHRLKVFAQLSSCSNSVHPEQNNKWLCWLSWVRSQKKRPSFSV